MGRRLLGIIILTIFSSGMVYSSALAIPMIINYQGKLNDPNGIVLNAEYQMSFSLFDVEFDGNNVWSEQQIVKVVDGIYNVHLGEVVTLSPNIFNNDNLFLEVEIESEVLSPRYKLTSAAFAIKAKEADSVRGIPAANLVISAEVNSKFMTHVFTDEQIPDNITIDYSATSGNAGTLGSSRCC